MVKKRTKLADTRKPTHSLDAARPSKGAKGGRDASTVRFFEFSSFCLSLSRARARSSDASLLVAKSGSMGARRQELSAGRDRFACKREEKRGKGATVFDEKRH